MKKSGIDELGKNADGVTLKLDCLKPKITPAWVVIADRVDKVVNLSTLHTLVVGPKLSWFEDCIFQ